MEGPHQDAKKRSLGLQAPAIRFYSNEAPAATCADNCAEACNPCVPAPYLPCGCCKSWGWPYYLFWLRYYGFCGPYGPDVGCEAFWASGQCGQCVDCFSPPPSPAALWPPGCSVYFGPVTYAFSLPAMFCRVPKTFDCRPPKTIFIKKWLWTMRDDVEDCPPHKTPPCPGGPFAHEEDCAPHKTKPVPDRPVVCIAPCKDNQCALVGDCYVCDREPATFLELFRCCPTLHPPRYIPTREERDSPFIPPCWFHYSNVPDGPSPFADSCPYQNKWV